jgi:hypothetical protein
LQQHQDTYGEQTLAALQRLSESPGELRTAVVTVDELADGMVLCEDLRTANGVVILPRGFAVNRSSREHIMNFANELRDMPITVRAPSPAAPGGLAVGAD